MFHAISYDISDDKRRNSVSKLLESYGTRVQYSVFEFNLNADQLAELMQELETVIDADQDSIRCYSLCSACQKNIIRLGGPPIADESAFYVV